MRAVAQQAEILRIKDSVENSNFIVLSALYSVVICRCVPENS